MWTCKQFTFGPFETNMYVMHDEQGHILLVDPACFTEEDRQTLMHYIGSIRTADSAIRIIATHGHLDHLWGAEWTNRQFGRPVEVHEQDRLLTESQAEQYAFWGLNPKHAGNIPVKKLENGDIPGCEIIVTPGHTPGSVCLYWPEEKILLSGDTLFRMGYGRTDLPGGNMMQLIDSLQHLFELPADVTVYPGHGEPTSIGDERR